MRLKGLHDTFLVFENDDLGGGKYSQRYYYYKIDGFSQIDSNELFDSRDDKLLIKSRVLLDDFLDPSKYRTSELRVCCLQVAFNDSF
jgi:hypothetical protein